MAEKPKSSKRLGLIGGIAAVGIVAMSGGAYLYVSSNSPEAARIKLQQMGIPFETTSFSEAVKKNDEVVLKLFLQAKMPIAVSTGDTPSALIEAVASGNLDFLEMASKNEVNLNEKDKSTGVTALLAAIFLKQPTVVGWLLQKKVDVSIRADNGLSAIEVAILMDDPDSIGELVKAGADVHQFKTYDADTTENFFGSISPNAENTTLETLPQAFKQIGTKELKGNMQIPPTVLAAEYERLNALEALFHNGADASAIIHLIHSNNRPVPAIISTFNSRSLDALDVWLKHDPVIYLDDKDVSDILLHHVTPFERDNDKQILHRILNIGTISDTHDADGNIARLQEAMAIVGDKEGLAILTKKGVKFSANVKSLDEYKYKLDESPLLGIMASDSSLADEVLEKIGELEKDTLRQLLTWSVSKDKEEWVPKVLAAADMSSSDLIDVLKLAITRNQKQSVQELLTRNVQEAWPEAYGPIGIWLYRNSEPATSREIIPLMKDNGVDLSTADSRGSTLFWYAWDAKDIGTMELLSKIGIKDIRSNAKAADDARKAINASEIATLKYLDSIGAMPDGEINSTPVRPLVTAAIHGNEEAIDILLKMKVPVGMDAVRAAAANNHGPLSNRLMGLIIEGKVPIAAEKLMPDHRKPIIGSNGTAIRLEPSESISPSSSAPKSLPPVNPDLNSGSKSLAPVKKLPDRIPKELEQWEPQDATAGSDHASLSENPSPQRTIPAVPTAPMAETVEKAYLSEENSQTLHPLEGKMKWNFSAAGDTGSLQATVEFPQRDLVLYFEIAPTRERPGEYAIYARFPASDLPTAIPVASVPGIILLKPAYGSDGDALQIAPIKPDGSGQFEFVLSADPAIYSRNFALLAERDWFEILVSYANGERAFVTFNKGETGQAAFAEAFRAWSSSSAQELMKRSNFDIIPPPAPSMEKTDILSQALQQAGVDLEDSAREMSPQPQYADPAIERRRLRALIQLRLNYLGLNAGTINGNYGSQTRKAIAKFQKILGRESTGKITVDEVKILYAFSDETGPTEAFKHFMALRGN